MEFDRAWQLRTIDIDKAEEATPEVNILYKDGKASLADGRYHDNEEAVKDTVKRAWETMCRGDETALSSIEQIIIAPKHQIAGEKQVKKSA